jgi:hypothetical protein
MMNFNNLQTNIANKECKDPRNYINLSKFVNNKDSAAQEKELKGYDS